MKDLISKLTNKILNETIEEKANEVIEKLNDLNRHWTRCISRKEGHKVC